jgi:mannan endo-1,4-beta-mannosidase
LWILSAKQDDGTLYPDFDGFTVYSVADNDLARTPNNTPVALNVTANDITYGDAPLRVDSIDLDATTPGRQRHLTTWGSLRWRRGSMPMSSPRRGLRAFFS